MGKRYVVTLTEEERSQLQKLVSVGKSAARRLNHARILLLADAEFVCRMEDVLELYRKPYDPRYPVLCMDEASQQLIAETRVPLPAEEGQPVRYDHEYERKGVCSQILFVEPLRGWRKVFVRERRTMVDWAFCLREILDVDQRPLGLPGLPAQARRPGGALPVATDAQGDCGPAASYRGFPGRQRAVPGCPGIPEHGPVAGRPADAGLPSQAVEGRSCPGPATVVPRRPLPVAGHQPGRVCPERYPQPRSGGDPLPPIAAFPGGKTPCLRSHHAEARRLLERVEFHYTPKHGSWLNMAEIEIGVMNGQCLGHRIDSQRLVAEEVAAWEQRRNHEEAKIHWTFTVSSARVKLTKIYPSIPT